LIHTTNENCSFSYITPYRTPLSGRTWFISICVIFQKAPLGGDELAYAHIGRRPKIMAHAFKKLLVKKDHVQSLFSYHFHNVLLSPLFSLIIDSFAILSLLNASHLFTIMGIHLLEFQIFCIGSIASKGILKCNSSGFVTLPGQEPSLEDIIIITCRLVPEHIFLAGAHNCKSWSVRYVTH